MGNRSHPSGIALAPGVERERKMTAWEVLAWPDDHQVPSYALRLPFWEIMQAVFYLADSPEKPDGQTIYLRFFGGTPPSQYDIEAFSQSPTLTLDNASHIVIRDCIVNGGTTGIKIAGDNARFNEVKRCDVFFGKYRIHLTGGASQNVIRDCRVQMRFIGQPPGAWSGAKKTADPKTGFAKRFVYEYYKYWASRNSISDDCSIRLNETSGNLLWNNELDGGVIGISLANVSNVLVQGNKVLRHSSVGTAIRDHATRVQFDRNHFEDNNINFRLHTLNMDSGRIVYLTNNASVLPEKLGHHIFCHVYTEEPPIPLKGSPEVFILHNTFTGGNGGLLLPPASSVEEGLPNFIILNNVFAVSGSAALWRSKPELMDHENALGVFDYNLIVQSPKESLPSAPWFGKHNIVSQDASRKPPTFDLRGAFQINGRTFGPVPNMDVE